MPEGPEITMIARYLDKNLKKKTLINFEILEKSRYKQKDYKERGFNNLIDHCLERVSFKGKKIIFDFGDRYLISFLGLEGKWVVDPIKQLDHGSIKLTFDDGTLAFYYDSRHFGCLEYITKDFIDLYGISNVGKPWILSEMYPNTIKKDEFFEMLQNKRLKNKKIMDFLLEQKYTAGVGNYIRADSLYLSKISPHRLINDISREESDSLYDSILKVMEESLNSNGHSLRSYFTPVGHKGGYSPYVYGLSKSKDTGEEVIKEKGKDNRMIHWVPSVQI